MNEKISPEVNHQTDEHEDFDPLAELARIVAGETEHVDTDPLPTETTSPETASPEESAIATDDLEAELMRELQQTELSENKTAPAQDSQNEQSGDLSSLVEDINELDASLDNTDNNVTSEEALEETLEESFAGFVVPAAPLKSHSDAPIDPPLAEPIQPQGNESGDFQNDLIDALQLELDHSAPEEQQVSEQEVEPDLETVLAAQSEELVEAISVEEEMATIVEETNDAKQAPQIAEDKDLGKAFLNEFESRIGYTNEENAAVAEAEITEVASAEEIIPMEGEANSDLEIDFEQAFSNELGLSSADDDEPLGALSSVDAIDDNVQPQYEDGINLDPGHSGEIPESAVYQPEEKSGGVKYAVTAIIIALLAGAGVAVYGFVGEDGSTMLSEAPVIEAIKSPYKTKPEDPGGKVVDNQDNATYAEVEGVANQNSGQTDLVSNTEEPAVLDQSSLDGSKSDDRLSNTEQSESAGATKNAVVKPRVVEIKTVKPDGTIIASAPTSTAPSKVEKEFKVVANQAKELATTVKTVATKVIEPLKPLDGAKTTNQIVAPTASPKEKPVVEAKKVEVTKPKAVAVPQQRPAKPEPTQVANVAKPLITQSNDQPTVLPNVQPAATTTTEVTSNATPASNWVVQVSSSPSQQDAQSSFNRLSRKYSVLQGRSMNIQPGNVNGRTYYRVRLNTASKADASNLCSQLKASGGDCFITR